MSMEQKNVMFHCEDIGMQFPGTVALQGVNLDIFEGEIVGLVGENGAGKSTLLKIILGMQRPTSGSMWMHGEKYAPQNPKEANRQGVGMVFQEQSLITNLTVGQNIFFGEEKKYTKGLLIQYQKMYQDAKAVLETVGLKDVKPSEKVSNLDFATRQMVEIAKVLQGVTNHENGKSLILLDEPTSVLNEEEIQTLFSEMKRLKEEGHAVIFVSHHLDEVIHISDRVYVFKDGREVGMLPHEEITENILYEKMVGRISSKEYYKEGRQKLANENVLFEVKNLGVFGCFKDISFQLHENEVLGICGVVGSGKEELCEVISGIEAPSAGEMFLKGKKINPKAPCDAVKKGIVCIPQERNEEGMIGSLSIFENITISNFANVSTNGLISKKKQIEKSNKWIKDLNIKCPSCKTDMNSLSGGNAQKVVFARALNSEATVLLLNHPTRGVDVGAKEEIYSLIRDAVDSGMGVIVLGDTLDECIGLSSRIIVLKDGLTSKEFICNVGNKPSQVEIVKYMM